MGYQRFYVVNGIYHCNCGKYKTKHLKLMNFHLKQTDCGKIIYTLPSLYEQLQDHLIKNCPDSKEFVERITTEIIRREIENVERKQTT